HQHPSNHTPNIQVTNCYCVFYPYSITITIKKSDHSKPSTQRTIPTTPNFLLPPHPVGHCLNVYP
ncbi:MAG: hypothetical protein ACO36I_12785, partial [Candidatus Latescibacterota bacterium]